MQACKGVKGHSALHILPSFDVIDGVVIDYMHCLLEGIGKKLCALWFQYSPAEYYIGRHIHLVDERMLSNKPPDGMREQYRRILIWISRPCLQSENFSKTRGSLIKSFRGILRFIVEFVTMDPLFKAKG